MSLFNTENRAKPVLKWAGGKSSLLNQLVQHFPAKFDRFIEPFLGGGAVAFSLREGVPTVLNDTNPELVNLYCVIRDFPSDLMQELNKLALEYSENFYYELRSRIQGTNIERAARTVFLNKTGFNGLYRQNSKGGFNVPFGKRAQCPGLYDRGNVLNVSKRLALAHIRNEDFEALLNTAVAGDFVYCDPPYEPISVTSSFNNYTSGGFSQCDQRRLARACKTAAERGAIVAVSNSSVPFIKEIYSDWDMRTMSARRSINSKGTARGEIEELLIILNSNSAKPSPFATQTKNFT